MLFISPGFSLDRSGLKFITFILGLVEDPPLSYVASSISPWILGRGGGLQAFVCVGIGVLLYHSLLSTLIELP